MSKRYSVEKTVTKMLQHLHTIIAEDLGLHVSYDTDHDPPRYYFTLDERTGALREFSTAREAARAFIAAAGASAAGAIRDAQRVARAWAARRRAGR